MVPLTADFTTLIGMVCMGGALVWFALGASFFLVEIWESVFGRIDAGRLKEE